MSERQDSKMTILDHLDKIVHYNDEIVADPTADREEVTTASSMICLAQIHVRDMVVNLQAENERLEEEVKAAAKLCEIYFNISAEFISEEEISKRRDIAIEQAIKKPPATDSAPLEDEHGLVAGSLADIRDRESRN